MVLIYCPSPETKKHPEGCFICLAVGQGFEPREPLGSTVFKTAAFDHSASPPKPIEERTPRKTAIIPTSLDDTRRDFKIKRFLVPHFLAVARGGH